jgi:hypothetical protein
MAANASGISGSQIFRTSDAPLYRHALTAVCALAGVAWIQVLALNLQSWYLQSTERKRRGVVAGETGVGSAVSALPSSEWEPEK